MLVSGYDLDKSSAVTMLLYILLKIYCNQLKYKRLNGQFVQHLHSWLGSRGMLTTWAVVVIWNQVKSCHVFERLCSACIASNIVQLVIKKTPHIDIYASSNKQCSFYPCFYFLCKMLFFFFWKRKISCCLKFPFAIFWAFFVSGEMWGEEAFVSQMGGD